MRIAFLKYGIVLTMLALSAGGLMYISQNVQRLQKDIASDNRAIDQEHEKIRVLKAEWAYLNDPARLEALASEAYDLQVPDVDSVISDTTLLLEQFQDPSSPASSPFHTSTPVSYVPSSPYPKHKGGRR